MGATSETTFRVTWTYDTTESRVTQWTIRYAVSGTGTWTELSLSSQAQRHNDFVLTQSDSGKTYAVEVIAVSDGTSSQGTSVEVTLSKYGI